MFVIVVGKSVVKRINDYHEQSLLMMPQCRVKQILISWNTSNFPSDIYALSLKPQGIWYLWMYVSLQGPTAGLTNWIQRELTRFQYKRQISPRSWLDQSHKYYTDAAVPYLTLSHSKQKCAQFCSQGSIVGMRQLHCEISKCGQCQTHKIAGAHTLGLEIVNIVSRSS